MKKAQSSIEFMLVLTLTLLTASILLSDLNDKAVDLKRSQDFKEAQEVARQTNHQVNMVKATKNMTITLDYPSGLSNDYTIKLNETGTEVQYNGLTAKIGTLYEGDPLTFNTTNSYLIKYQNEGVVIE